MKGPSATLSAATADIQEEREGEQANDAVSGLNQLSCPLDLGAPWLQLSDLLVSSFKVERGKRR